VNLKNFLNYKEKCPICKSNLTIVFHSQRKQILYQEDGIFKVFFPLSHLSFKTKYKACYCINEEDNSIYIDFYNNKKILTEIPVEYLKSFRLFDKNLKDYQVYKCCKSCVGYSYISNHFLIDYINSSIGDLEINNEIFTFSHFTENNSYFYKIFNYPIKNLSYVFYGKCKNSSEELYQYSDTLQIPLLNFSSKEKIIERINKLIIFS